MNIRDAILKAADHIDRHPSAFQFSERQIPNDCGTPGCAVGHVLRYLGYRNDDIFYPCQAALGVAETTFYGRMNHIHGGTGWVSGPQECAATLRQYADKYHPEEIKHTGIPQNVRNIFDRVAA